MTASGLSPRILYLTPFSPDGPPIGARVRSESVLHLLRQAGNVEQVILDGGELRERVVSLTPRHESLSVNVVELPRKGVIQKVRWTLDSQSPFPNRFRVDDEGVQRLQALAASFDLVWLFKLHAADLFPPQLRWPRAVLDVDDLPSQLEQTRMTSSISRSERLQALRNRFAWRRRERLLGHRFNVLSVCSGDDKLYLRRLGVDAPIYVIPNGFARPAEEPVRNRSTPPRIGFVGFLEFLPNRKGLQWFIENCWSLIRLALPEVRLRIVGKGSDGLAFPDSAGIEFLGGVSDADEEMRTWSAMIVPIHTGAGMRIKIAHAFSQKCPLVSTTLGAFGYGAENGRTMLIADEAEDFAQACLQLVRNPEEADSMADRAWQEFLQHWTWDAIRPVVSAAVEDCLRAARLPGEAHG